MKQTLRLALFGMLFGLPAATLAQSPAPASLTAISGATQSLLSWSASTGAASYNVQRSSTSGGPYALLVNVSSQSYTDSAVTNGVEYYYVVAAVSNGVAGANSPEAAAIPLATGGYYTFINRSSGLALGETNGVAEQQYYTGVNQLWKLVSLGGGYFALLNNGIAGLTLSGPTPSAQLIVSGFVGNNAQTWSFQVTNGYYFVSNLGAGQVLDNSGATINQENFDGAPDENWAVSAPMPVLMQAASVTNDDQLPQAYVSAQIYPNGSPTTVVIQFGTNTAYGLAVTNILAVSGGYQTVNAIFNSYLDRATTLHAFITASNATGIATSGDLTCSSLLFEKKFSSDFDEESFNWLIAETGAATWVDFNNDGWLDLVCAGQQNTQSGEGCIYFNPGTNQITSQTDWITEQLMPNGSHPAVAVGDFDNDNRPDLFYACSTYSEGLDFPEFGGAGPQQVTGVMFGVDTNFIGNDETETLENTSYVPYLHVQDANVAVGDFDHTGRQDALVSGNFYTNSNSSGLVGPFTVLCQNNLPAGRDIGFNIPGVIGTEGMVPVNTSLPPVCQPASADDFSSGETLLVAGDFDNDGFLDLFALNFPIDSTLTPYAGFFHGDGNKNFTPTTNRFQVYPGTSGPNFAWVESASCVLADLNGDGYLDMVLSYVNGPENGTGSVGPTTNSIWLNDGHGNLTNSNIVLPQLALANFAVGDIFNHGRNDILMVGGVELDETVGTNVIQTVVLRNDGNGVFTPIVLGNFGSIGETGHGLQLADYDNDGRLDFAMTGDTMPAGVLFSRFVPGTYIFRNEMNIPSNAPPAAPPGLGATVGNGTVRFHWGNATDDITPASLLTYNLRVGTNSLDTSVVSPIANVTNGWRKLAAPGNCGHVTTTLYRFPPGTYYWSVQAVDGGFKGGAWAPEQTFTITNAEPVMLTLNHPADQPYPYTGALAALQTQMALMNDSSNIFNVTSNSLNLSWPTRFKGYTVEQATNLAGPWTTNTPPIGTLDGEWSVLLTNSGTMFFRLQQ
ncbi:MAG TPA: FG-GAP-like repeat-containing protein [Verrucomicrobiae bacterium]